MARSAMQLQPSLTPDAELPAVELPRVRTLVEIRLEDALNERVHYPFTMDARSIREHVEILAQLPEGVLRVLVTSERLFSSTTYIFIFWTIGSSILLFGIAVIFMRNQVKPIRRLARDRKSTRLNSSH